MGIKSIEKELSEIREKGSPQISEEVCDKPVKIYNLDVIIMNFLGD